MTVKIYARRTEYGTENGLEFKPDGLDNPTLAELVEVYDNE